MIGIGTARDRTIHAGTLVQIDARNHADSACIDGTAYTTATTGQHACLDEENATFQILTPNVPSGSDPSPVGRYREPSVLPDGRILVSWADGPVNDMNEQSLTAPDFGIYIYDATTGQNQLVYNDRATWDLNALAVVPRATPHFIGAAQNVQDATVPVRIGSVNVSETSLNEVVSGAQFNNTPLSEALQPGDGRGPRHRGLLERGGEGRDDVRPHDVRGRSRPRRGARLLRRKLARERPAVHPDAPPADRQVRPRDPEPGALDPGNAERRPALRRLPRVAHDRRLPGLRSEHGRRAAPRRRVHRADREPHGVPLGQEGPAAPRFEVRELPQHARRPATTT